MPRYAQAVGEDGQEYKGETVRKAGGAWAIFQEPPSPRYPDGAFVVHRWLPYLLMWMPVTQHATQDEARARIEETIAEVEALTTS